MENLQNEYESLMQRASRLRLSAFSIAEGMRTGSFRSMFRGHGIEFTGVRDYLRGDDVRTIDWNVTARMGRPFVKLFDEDRELIVFIVLDCSRSMQTGFSGRSRQEAANEAAALLAFAAEQNASPLGAVLFDGEIGFSAVPKAGRNNVMLFLRQLENPPRSQAQGSALAASLQGAYRLLKNRSLVVVISDFRAAAYESALACMAAKHDVVALRITDPSDTELPDAGYLPFEDPESKAVRAYPLSSGAFQREWKQSGKERLERWQTMCSRRGVSALSLSTKDDAAQVLSRFFSAKEKR